MGTYSDLNSGGGGGTYRQAQGGTPPTQPASADPRQSGDYKALVAAAKQSQANADKVLDSLGPVGGVLRKVRDVGAGALSAVPFSDEGVGLLDKTLVSGANVMRKALGQPTVDPDAAYYAGKDTANAQTAASMKASPITAHAAQLAAMIGGPGELAAGAKALPAVKAAGSALADAAPGLLDVASNLGAKVSAAIPQGSLLRAATQGGLLGGLYGAGEGEGVQQRVTNAEQGAIGGAALGGALHAVVPAVGGGVKMIGDTGKAIGDLVRKPFLLSGGDAAADAAATPQQLEQARVAAAQLAARAGLTTPEAISGAAAAKFGDKPATAAEVLGRSAVSQLGALGKRGGATPQALEDLLGARARGAGERIKEDFGTDLGISPDEAGGDIDAITEAAQQRANPLYATALAGSQGVTNPVLEQILTRPVVQKAMREVEADFRNQVRGSTGLAMGQVEVPPDAAGVHPMDAPDVGDVPLGPDAQPPVVEPTPAAPVPRGPAVPPSQGPSLATFIRQQGLGISDDGGELAGKGLRINLKGGGSLDDYANQAGQAGYFPELKGERPTINDLLGALDEESRGNPRYAQAPDPAAQGRFDARAAGEGQNRALEAADAERQAQATAAFHAQQASDAQSLADWHKQQAEVGPSPDDWKSLATGTETPQGGAPASAAPQFEPATQEAYTPAAWNAIKRKVGDLVQRDDAGRPITSGTVGSRNAGFMDASRDLTDALAGSGDQPGALGPDYRAALDAAGDKLKVQNAFQRMSGKLTTGDMRTFGRFWGNLKTPAEQDAGRAALANDVLNMANRGQLRGGKFTTPGIQARLELAFGGKGNVSNFLAKMEQEAALARTGGRMMPGTGSGTAEWQGALDGGEDNPAATAGEVLGHMASGSWTAAVKALLKQYGMKAWSWSRKPGTPVQVQDEYGRLLMLDPASFGEFLATRDPASLKPFRSPAGAIGGAVAGEALKATNR